jgi:outer membrane biosynthesis protein TonB
MSFRKKTKILSLIIAAVAISAVTASGQDSEPVMKNGAVYSLPQAAVDAGIGGAVSVAVKVGSDGRPVDVAVIAGPMWPCGASPTQQLKEVYSTLEATIMKLEFSPAMRNGKPASASVALRFYLKNPKIEPRQEIDPATGKRKATHVSGGVLNGKARHLPKPEYPFAARANRDSGVVTIQILIDESGNVVRAGAVSGPQTLQGPARESACLATFVPTKLQGNPIKVSGVLTYNFVP